MARIAARSQKVATNKSQTRQGESQAATTQANCRRETRSAQGVPTKPLPVLPPCPEPEPATEALTPAFALQELVRRASTGSSSALANLRQFLDKNPSVSERAGDLAAIAERAWTDLVVGENVLVAESVKRQLARLKAEIKGPHPTRLESLLADQIAVCWLGMQHGEMQVASPAGGSLDQATMKLRRAESAQKRYMNAMKTLATLRTFASKGLAPLPSMRVFDPNSQLA